MGKNYEVLVRVPRFVVLRINAKNKSEINKELDRERLSKVIDYGEWLFDEAELDIYDAPYEEQDFIALEDFNSGDFLNSL